MPDEELPARVESEVSENGIKTVTEYVREADGRVKKVVSQVKVVRRKMRLPRGVLDRQKWARFGEYKGQTGNPFKKAEEFTLVMKERSTNYYVPEQDALKKKLSGLKMGKCAFCGETGHITLRCPKRREIDVHGTGVGMASTMMPSRPSGGGVSATGAYVPAHRRDGYKGSSREDRDANSIKISNIPSWKDEDQLRELCRSFGRTERVYLCRDRRTGESRGFAFVSYMDHSDAQKAIDTLNGLPIDRMILSAEWAKPRPPRQGDAKAPAGGPPSRRF